MDKKTLNNYKLTSLEEPTDEMLEQIMQEVLIEAKEKAEQSEKEHFVRLKTEVSNALHRFNLL